MAALPGLLDEMKLEMRGWNSFTPEALGRMLYRSTGNKAFADLQEAMYRQQLMEQKDATKGDSL